MLDLGQALDTRLRNLPSSHPAADELQAIGKRIRKLGVAKGLRGTPVKIGLIASFLTDMLANALVASLAQRGILAELSVAPYGALPGLLLSEPSYFADRDLLLVLPTHRDLLHVPGFGCSDEEADEAAAREVGFWAGLWRQPGCPIIQLGFDPPPTRALSEADGFIPGGLLRHVRAVNRGLYAGAGHDVAIVDAEALAAAIGPAWHDARTYALCKQPFANDALAELSGALAAAAAGVLGKARKVLVLDLDNTLWGGIVGDVGLGGLSLGMEAAEGEAFVGFQRYVRALAARGVILAICSKNNHDIALDAFRNHSGMVLKEEEIGCFAINFEDKATNLRRIAETLNVGLDSLVFADDNPVERSWVKAQLPMVLVIDLPSDPAGYVQAVEAARPFPAQRLTAEDRERGRSYRARTLQAELAASATDHDAFLASLEPVASFEPLSPATSDRVVQLIAKTNQFKLNPSRFSLDELQRHGRHVLILSFADRMQDYGIVAVCVFERGEGAMTILNWVMSCRVFSRRLEHAMLAALAGQAESLGVSRIDARFEPSPRNDVARDFLLALGFKDTDDGWLRIGTDGAPDASRYMTIKDRSELA